MSTNSTIIVEVDGKVKSIYCHWDGHIESVGYTLRDYFGTQGQAAAIVALGDCSTITGATNIGEIEAYHRDKGEDWADVKPRVYPTVDAALADADTPYKYAFVDGKWLAWEDDNSVSGMSVNDAGKLKDQDDKVIAEWTRIFRLSRTQDVNVQQSMKDATLFIVEEYDIVHPEMFEVKEG